MGTIENQVAKKMENDTETAIKKGLKYQDPPSTLNRV